jgi:predicted component of type VI protein secretion system
MWNLDFVEETLEMQRQQLEQIDQYIRMADYQRDMTEQVKIRQDLLNKHTALEEIRDEMAACEKLEEMNDLISQKALVYTLIQKYTASPAKSI